MKPVSPHKMKKQNVLIGREQEIKWIVLALKSGRHVLLEGPVGSGKTFLAHQAIQRVFPKKTHYVRVDGDSRFTEQKLVGTFDPKLTLKIGFKEKSFIRGPLYECMTQGKILLINELNRMPEMVQNVLLPALDEGKIQVPYLGEVIAKKGFAVIATQNSREFVGTSALSEALLDRMEWLSIQYLSFEDECNVLEQNCPLLSTEQAQTLVRLIRLTRDFQKTLGKIRRGASLRAAIALGELTEAHFKTTGHQEAAPQDSLLYEQDWFWVLAKMALSNRIELATSKFAAQTYLQHLDEVMQLLKTLLMQETTLESSKKKLHLNKSGQEL